MHIPKVETIGRHLDQNMPGGDGNGCFDWHGPEAELLITNQLVRPCLHWLAVVGMKSTMRPATG